MKEIIGQYSLESRNSSFKLNYNTSSKGKFDILISGIIGVFLLAFMIFIGFGMLEEEFNWFNIVILVIYSIGCFWKIYDFISLCLRPINEIISYNNSTRKITVKYNLFKRKEIYQPELNKLEYEMISLSVQVDTTKIKKVHWIELYAVTKSQKKIKILEFDSDYILDVGTNRIQQDLLKNAKLVIKKIAEKLDVECRYNGIINK